MVQLLLLLAPHALRTRARRRPFAKLAALAATLWLVFAFATAAHSAERTAITVLCWNVENYLPTDRLVEGVFRKDFPKPEAEKTALRAVIKTAAPDILALQEMGPEPYLIELQRDLAAEGLHYSERILLQGPDSERHLAILSKIPIASIHRHTDIPYRLDDKPGKIKRGSLEITLRLADENLTLFLVHLKSRYTTDARDPEADRERLAEATALRDLVLKRFPDPKKSPFALIGDFNDSPRSRPLRALLKRGDTEIARIVPAADPDGDTWTHFYRKEETYSRIDYILASPAFLKWIDASRAHILDSPQVRPASDHRPLLFTLRPPKK